MPPPEWEQGWQQIVHAINPFLSSGPAMLVFYGIEYSLGTVLQSRLDPDLPRSSGNSILRSSARHGESVHSDRHDARCRHVLYPHASNIGQR